MNKKNFRCCFTGHRPNKLVYSEDEIKSLLEKAIEKAISYGYVTFITGMAQGTDIWAAEIVIENADYTKVICERYFKACYQRRNEFMVDHSNLVIAVWNGMASGTKNTIDYAKRKGVKVVNILQEII